MQWFLTFFAHWTSKSKKELPRTKLGRIHSNLFEFRFFEFAILNSNSEFESQKLWLRPNSTVEFEESSLNSKKITIYRPKMHKIHPFWSKKKVIFDYFGVKFDQIRKFRTSKFEIDWSNSNFWPEFNQIRSPIRDWIPTFFKFLSRIRNSSELTTDPLSIKVYNRWTPN